jgi:hypothetical protein
MRANFWLWEKIGCWMHGQWLWKGAGNRGKGELVSVVYALFVSLHNDVRSLEIAALLEVP